MKRKKRGGRKGLVIAGGAVVVLCTLVAIIGSLGGGGDGGGTPTAARVEEVAQATLAVPTVAPTRTPVPTETRSPTATKATTATPTTAPTAGKTEARVSRVVDGDTIVVVIDGQSFDLRYIGIDSAEAGDVFGAEATAANEALVGGRTVYLEKDVSETDRYGRLLRYVYLADGTFVNAELVRGGFAEAKDYPPDSKYRDLLDEAEQEARVALVGVWAAAPAATPATRGGTVAGGADVKIVKVYNKGTKEYVEITNGGLAAQDMSEWSVSGSKGDDRFWFPAGFVLEPGATVRLHSGDDGVDSAPSDLYWSRGKPVWNNSGETVYLWDADGKLVSEYGY